MATPRTRNRFAGQGDFIKDSGVQKWVNIFGDVQVIQNLRRLESKIERKIVRKAIAKGLKPIVKLAKQNAREKTGLLRSAIKSKVTKMVSGKVYVDPMVFAVKNSNTGGKFKEVKIRGPMRGMKYRDLIKGLEKHGGATEVIKPAKYAHLLEFGTKHARARPFMRPALQQSRASALSEIENEARKGIAEEANK